MDDYERKQMLKEDKSRLLNAIFNLEGIICSSQLRNDKREILLDKTGQMIRDIEESYS